MITGTAAVSNGHIQTAENNDICKINQYQIPDLTVRKREKAKNKGMKERIAEETSELREHNRDLQIQMKTMFQKDKVPVFCRTTFYYSLYYARGLKERLIGFITFLICFLALPCGVYFLLPDLLRSLCHSLYRSRCAAFLWSGSPNLSLPFSQLPTLFPGALPVLLSVLQKYIDRDWNDKDLKVILCGSALSFMEKKVLSEKSPLFGRRDSQIKLEAFNYLDAAKFVPNYSNEDKAICYGITGGVAKYLSMIDPKKSMDENIVRLFFRTDGYLYDETRNLLTQEFEHIIS